MIKDIIIYLERKHKREADISSGTSAGHCPIVEKLAREAEHGQKEYRRRLRGRFNRRDCTVLSVEARPESCQLFGESMQALEASVSVVRVFGTGSGLK